jgi:hypothetical protein
VTERSQGLQIEIEGPPRGRPKQVPTKSSGAIALEIEDGARATKI